MTLNKDKFAKVLLVAITLLIIFSAIGEVAKTVDLGSVPEPFVTAVTYVVTFLTSITGITLVALGRNLLGYFREYFRMNYKEVYDMNKLYETLALYLGIVTTALTIVPSPYDSIVIGIVIIADFVLSEYEKLKS